MHHSAWLRPLLLAGLLSAATAGPGCSTIEFVRTPDTQTFTDPVYSSSKEFFFWGLAGPQHDIYVDRICLGKEVDQIATTYTASDVALNLLTLGIYSPHSVQVWCRL